jgi:hypothetical protein
LATSQVPIYERVFTPCAIGTSNTPTAKLQLRASREAQEPRNALDMMDVVWEVGAADEKLSSKVTSNAADPLAASSTSGTQTSEDIEVGV